MSATQTEQGAQAIVQVRGLTKTYNNGHQALKNIDLDIMEGEILALLGPNGAGKTTLISTICGLVNATGGTVTVGGYDHVKQYRNTRKLIGLVPQELALGDKLSLGDKATSPMNRLSGGMKRRVLIAKALAHEPRVLFLDEPTAGVDVELRKDMWKVIDELRKDGVTIILTTHYIEEAEAIADRVGVISAGEILLIDDKKSLMEKMGEKLLQIELREPTNTIPPLLETYNLRLNDEGTVLTYAYDIRAERTGITQLLSDVQTAGLALKDISTSQSSLEDIFVNIVKADA